MKNKYKELKRQMKQACRELKWKFSVDSGILKRFDVEDGFGFTIDKVEYMVTFFGAEDTTLQFDGYYASTIVQEHGNREEPPSEDEMILTGENSTSPDGLMMRILNAHWKVRLQWALEALQTEDWIKA